MSGLNFLFGSSVPSSVTTSASGTSTIPAWLQDFTRSLMVKATDIASQPYTPYNGPRLADVTPQQQQAWQLVQDNVGVSRDFQNLSRDALGYGSQGFNPTEFARFMNPYTSGVVDEIGRLGNRNFTENILPKVNDAFTGAGMFGGSRNMLMAGRAARDAQTDILGKQADYLASGFQNQMNNYNTAKGTSINAAQAAGPLAQTMQTLGLNDANALEAVGRTIQGQNQQSLDLAYKDFISQRDYPLSQLAMLQGIIQGMPISQSSTNTSFGSPSPTASPLSQATSAALSGAALLRMFGG